MKKGLLLVFFIMVSTAFIGFSQINQPYIGYVYPAGGQAGTTFVVTIGGQNLRGANAVYFSKSGISATVIDYQGPSGPLNQLQIEELRRRIQEIRDRRAGRKPAEDTRTETEKKVVLPDLPDLRNLERKTPKELALIYEKYLNRQNKPKPPIAEEVQIQVKIEPDTIPGNYEIWLKTPRGLTNPVVFQVGEFPEFCCTYNQYRYENENIDRETTILQVPVVINGRILPGKTNRFTLQLKRDQEIMILAQARKLIPYLADAVPGWFQAVIALYDKNWKEVSYADDFYFQPDPFISLRVPETGIYFLEIRDSIYRGREDFIYRIYVMEKTDASNYLTFLTGQKESEEKIFALLEMLKNTPEYRETELKMPAAQSVSIPVLIKGCINYPGDIDRYRFYGKQGDVIAIELYGRRFGYPIDSIIRLKNQMEQILEWNDDMKNDLENGTMTHHADSFLLTKLPSTGNYTVEVIDAQGHGGESYRYFLRITKPQYDFRLIVSPSRINIPYDGIAVITVHAIKKDGWDGDIELSLKNAPAGFVLDGGKIPAGRNTVRVTLKAPARYSEQTIPINIEGRSRIGEREVIRTAMAAEEQMQAFAYKHLVPSEKLIVSLVRGRTKQIKPDTISRELLKIPAGGTATTSCEIEKWFKPNPSISISFELNNPPDGIKIKDIQFDSGRYLLTVEADRKLIGYRDNLIIEVFEESSQQQGKRKNPIGFLPAIPFEVVKND